MELNREQVKKELVLLLDDMPVELRLSHKKTAKFLSFLKSILTVITTDEQKIFELENRLKECENGYEGTLHLERCKLHDAEEKIEELTAEYDSVAKSLNEASDLIRKLRSKHTLDERHKFCNLVGDALIYTKTLEDYNKLRADFRADTAQKFKSIITEKCAVSKMHYVYNAEPTITYELTNWQLDQIAKEITEGI